MSNYGPPGGGGSGPPGGGFGPPGGQGPYPPQVQQQPQGQQPQYPQQPQGQQPPYPQQPPGQPYPQQPRYPQQGQPQYPPQPQYGGQGQGFGPPGPGAPQHSFGPPRGVAPRDPDRTRRLVGLWLWIIGMVIGIGLNIVFTLMEVVFSRRPGDAAYATMIGALMAFPPLLVYLFVPAIIDRYDPEPWWCLAMAFLWGALVATGFAGMINTGVLLVASDAFGKQTGDVITAVLCAPLTEEFWKGLCVLGFFYFLRREFDGVVDGIIYATFCALGFAAVENVSYYARAAAQGQNVLVGTFVIRGILAPWGHPLYTSMTGIGFGIARESTSTAVRWLAPVGFYFIGVSMHATWNLVPSVFGEGVFLASLVLWLLFVLGFFLMIVVLVIRKGRVIRDNLKDEVLIGNLSQEDVNLICSPVGRLKCTFSWRGATGRNFIRAAARLALSKWHTARAMKGQKRTISADFIVPLRDEMRTLRQQLAARAPQPVGPPGYYPPR